LERPDLHFAEALAAELRLAAERLLRDERVRPDRARVDLVVDQVRQLEHVDVAHRHVLLERHARHAVVKARLAAARQARSLEPLLDLALGRAVEDRRREVQAERVRGPAEVRLENLADVHTRRNAERVEHDFHRRAIRQIRHVLFGQDARDDALVAVAAGHLFADRQLSLHRDVALYELDHAPRQVVAAANLLLLLLELALDDVHALRRPVFHLAQFVFEAQVVRLDARAHERRERNVRHGFLRERRALAEHTLAAVCVEQIGAERTAVQELHEALLRFLVEDSNLVLQVLFHQVELFLLDLLGAVVLLDALAREDPHADDDALDARRARQRRILHVSGLFTEDRAEQLLFRRELRLPLRRDLADEDVARLHVRADADDAALVEIAQVALR